MSSYIFFLGIHHEFPLFPVAENTADHIENSIHDQTDTDKHPQNRGGAEGVSNNRDAAENGDRYADRHPKPLASLHADDVNSPLQLRDTCN